MPQQCLLRTEYTSGARICFDRELSFLRLVLMLMRSPRCVPGVLSLRAVRCGAVRPSYPIPSVLCRFGFSQVVVKLAALALALMAASAVTQHYGNRLTPWIRRSSTILITTFAVVYGVYLLLAHTK